jgi:hypothetical protein
MVRGVEAFAMQNNGQFVTSRSFYILALISITEHCFFVCIIELINLQCTHAADCRDYFSRSLFIVGEIGGNDYITMFNNRLRMTELRSHASTIVQTIAGTIKVS